MVVVRLVYVGGGTDEDDAHRAQKLRRSGRRHHGPPLRRALRHLIESGLQHSEIAERAGRRTAESSHSRGLTHWS